jgi:hypothetical protein
MRNHLELSESGRVLITDLPLLVMTRPLPP